MIDEYTKCAQLFKVLSDPNRVMIVDMLSCGELCACKILEKFNITQPTLSHHMKILCDSGLVRGRKDGKWMHYSINTSVSENAINLLSRLTYVTTDEADTSNEQCC